MKNREQSGRVLHRRIRAGAVVAGVGLVILAGAGTASADPLDQCPPGVLMRAQADQLSQLANYLAAHPDAGNADSPVDAVAALQMAAGLRNIQAGVADSCGLTMDQLMPNDVSLPPGAVLPPGPLPPG